TSAVPNTPTSAVSARAAAAVPANALRQLMVMPTTSTIVNASTNSTADARNAATNTAHCVPISLLERITAHRAKICRFAYFNTHILTDTSQHDAARRKLL